MGLREKLAAKAAERMHTINVGDYAVRVTPPTGADCMEAGLFRVQAAMPPRDDGALEEPTDGQADALMKMGTAALREVSLDGGETWEPWEPGVSLGALPVEVVTAVLGWVGGRQAEASARVASFPAG